MIDFPQKAKGKYLTNLVALYGIRRRWFGLEPDFMLRKRALKIIYASTAGTNIFGVRK